MLVCYVWSSLRVECLGTSHEGLGAGKGFPTLPFADELTSTFVEDELDSTLLLSAHAELAEDCLVFSREVVPIPVGEVGSSSGDRLSRVGEVVSVHPEVGVLVHCLVVLVERVAHFECLGTIDVVRAVFAVLPLSTGTNHVDVGFCLVEIAETSIAFSTHEVGFCEASHDDIAEGVTLLCLTCTIGAFVDTCEEVADGSVLEGWSHIDAILIENGRTWYPLSWSGSEITCSGSLA